MRDVSNNKSQSPLAEQERLQMLTEWNQTQRDYPQGVCLHTLFEQQVERTPDLIAVEYENQRWTYREFNRMSNRLAHYLRKLGVGPEILVGVFMERSPEMIFALYAILKAGGAYAPLDPNHPAQRIEGMLTDANVRLLLTQRTLVDQLPEIVESKVLVLEDISQPRSRSGNTSETRQQPRSRSGNTSENPQFPNSCESGYSADSEDQSCENPISGVGEENLAYVIFTSGSTGRPKGVAVEHKSICNRLQWMQEEYRLTENDRVLQKTPYSFDVSVWELFWPLQVGARLVVAPKDAHRDVLQLTGLIEQYSITTLHFVPSMLQAFLDHEDLKASCHSLKRVICSGEELTVRLQDRFFASLDCELHNLYGPTEAAVDVTFWRCEPETSRPFVPIGRPVANTQIHILDRQLRPTAVGVPGELYIGGVQVARGYVNRPELTAEKFVPDPFSTDPKRRLYKTGDLAQWLEDGALVFLGRIDQQIKIRGFRVELGEIESVLEEHPSIQAAAVHPTEAALGAKKLVGYVVVSPERTFEPILLREHLQAKLPDYMIPSRFVQLDRLPLTPSGKLDRAGLPVLDFNRPDLETPFIPPTTLLQKKLSGLWREVLGIDRIGLHDNFFDLGGQSLMAMQVISGIRSQLNASVPITTFFNAPTIKGLADFVEHQGMAAPDIKIAPKSGNCENGCLSFGQERMWFQTCYERQLSISNHVLLSYDLLGMIDKERLARCLTEVVRRHEILRTDYREVDGRPRQFVRQSENFELNFSSLHQVPQTDRDLETQRWAELEAREPFDLQEGPILRARLLEYSERERVLILVFHHIAFDGWSEGVVFRELDALYRADANGESSPLTELPIQYMDFAIWQRDNLTESRLEHSLAFWKRYLDGSPDLLEIPTDHPRPSRPTFQGQMVTGSLPRGLSESIKKLGLDYGATPYMTLLAAFNVLLSRYSQSKDIVVGAALANRQLGQVHELIGFFVNSLPIRTDLSGNPTFRELLERVRKSTLDAYSYQDVPFEKIVAAVLCDRESSHASLFQVMFVLQDAAPRELSLADVRVSRRAADPGTARMDLVINVYDHPEGFEFWFEYNTDLFEQATIERMFGHFQQFLTAIVDNPNEHIGQLDLLTSCERQQVLVEWNQTQTEYPRTSSIHHLFEAKVYEYPDKIAVSDECTQLTYVELNQRANQLAHYLADLGIKRGTPVGICLDRSVEMIVSILGILKAGGAYVPLDSSYPRERFAYMLADTEAPVLISDTPLAKQLPNYKGRRLLLDPEKDVIQSYPTTNPKVGGQADDVAYVMYTSGSTGKPKGTRIPHRGVVRLVCNTNYVSLGSDEVFLQFAPLSFDASTFEIWAPLLNGGRLVMFPPGLPSLDELGEFVRDNGINTLWLTAGLFHQFGEAQFNYFRGIRQLLVGGDVVSPRQARMALEKLPECRLINGYGPTENTTFTTCYPMDSANDVGETVSIGRPIANTQVYVLDRYQQPVPIGVPGELYIGGDGLALDYVNQKDLTNEKFIPNPFNGSDSRLYRTGDLVRWRADGDLQFLGRRDQQVKIRGYRIELEEIETVLSEHPAVKQAAVQPRELSHGDKQLVGYVVAEADSRVTSSELREFLNSKLPNYMIPLRFVQMDALPLTRNGKLNRRALPEPGPERPGMDSTYTPPSTPQEKSLVGIWQDVLKIDQVGVHDNFFEMGGQSLSAVQVASRIQTIFGKKIPLVDLMSAKTVAKQAALLARTDAKPEVSLLSIRSQGSKIPLVFMPDIGGEAPNHISVFNGLPADQPVIGLQIDYASNNQPAATMEAIAAKCVEALKSSDLRRPFRLAGYSFGGLLAYEVARQLRNSGEPISSVLVIDTGPTSDNPRSMSRASVDVIRFWGNFPSWLLFQFKAYGVREIWTRISRKVRSLGQRLKSTLRGGLRTKFELKPDDIWDMNQMSKHQQEVYRVHLRAFLQYRPESYPDRITLFRCRIRPLFHGFEPDLGWSRFDIGEVNVIDLPVDHISVLREPYSHLLAHAMSRELEQEKPINEKD